ncbi:MAG TPA: hypothetical protein VF635_02835 [Propionibacteriaceae bacterium]
MHEIRSDSPGLERLYQAQTQHEYVNIERSIEGADRVTGYVVGVGSDWLLVSVYDNGAANGWVSLRIDDVADVSPAPGGQFVRRGLEYRRSWPARPPGTPLTLSSGPLALTLSAASAFPLVTLFAEGEDPYHFFLGRPVSWTTERMHWQEMNVAAGWEEEPVEWVLDSVTRVDIGGRYQAALARVAQLRGI